jgi:hypothetical protein
MIWAIGFNRVQTMLIFKEIFRESFSRSRGGYSSGPFDLRF